MDLQRLRQRHTALETKASAWRTRWQEIAENVRPGSLRLHPSKAATAAAERNDSIINCEPALASRTLAAGLHSGITSPSRPWLRLGVSDPALEQQSAVKAYLTQARDKLLEQFAKANVYGALASLYADLADYGTGLIHLDEDDEDVFRAYVFPLGSFVLENSPRLSVDTYFHRTTMTVRQLVDLFGVENVSLQVRTAYETNRLDDAVEVARCVLPNPSPAKPVEKSTPADRLPWLSFWWEHAPSGADGAGKFLRVSGYREKPFMAPRWEVTGEDVYGSSPGSMALGDCKALQVLEIQRAKMHAKLVDPPVAAASSLAQVVVSLLPGGVTHVPGLAQTDAVKPIHLVDPRAPQVAAADIRVHEERIGRAYFADLWLMQSQSETTMTAREVAERREEKLLQLGHVLEKLQDELLEPLVNRALAILERKGLLPEAPEELKGQAYKVEYVSMMAQAQKTLGLTAIDRTAGFVANLAQQPAFASAADKLDVDKTVEAYAVATGVPPDMIRDDKAVAKLRTERAKQAKQQQAMAAAPEAAKTVKTLGDTDTSKLGELNEMLRAAGVR